MANSGINDLEEAFVNSTNISLGHVGVYVADIDRAKAFYCGVIGLKLSDEVAEQGIAFLSGDGQREHHELLLCQSAAIGTSKPTSTRIQQLAFRCGSLEELQEKYQRLLAAGTQIEMTVSHGTAVGVYAFDPEGNRFELYWDTGIWAKQPFMQDVDLTLPAEELSTYVRSFAQEHASDGYVAPKYRQQAYLDIGQ